MPTPRDDTRNLPGSDRWPPLLVALRRAARPDRARVAAYLSLTRDTSESAAYTEFLDSHRAWIASLDRALSEAGSATSGPLPDAAERVPEGAAAPGLSPPRSRAHALGYLYVFEAFRLGCSVLARRLRSLVGTATTPAAPGSGQRPWGDLVEALESVPPEEQPAVIEGALEAFSAWKKRVASSLARLGLGSTSSADAGLA